MSASRYPCFECAEPFDDVDERDVHQRVTGHGHAQVQLDAIDRARYSLMGDDAPPPESAYHDAPDPHRRRWRLIPGGRR